MRIALLPCAAFGLGLAACTTANDDVAPEGGDLSADADPEPAGARLPAALEFALGPDAQSRLEMQVLGLGGFSDQVQVPVERGAISVTSAAGPDGEAAVTVEHLELEFIDVHVEYRHWQGWLREPRLVLAAAARAPALEVGDGVFHAAAELTVRFASDLEAEGRAIELRPIDLPAMPVDLWLSLSPDGAASLEITGRIDGEAFSWAQVLTVQDLAIFAAADAAR